jgi:penicillin-binding protein 1A
MQLIANKSSREHLEEYQQIFNKNWNWDKNKGLLSSMVDRAIRNSEDYRNAASTEDKADVYNKLKNNEQFIEKVKKTESTVQVGFVVIDPATGHIKALVGGENQDFGRGLNHVTGIRRQPGSSFKPFIYLTAIENGYYPAYTLLNQKFNYNGWEPENANFEYSGYMTLREALAFSVNVISGRMTISNIAPPSQVVSISKRMGINSTLSQYPSIALGTSEVTPLEITSAFGTIANHGIHVILLLY